MLLLLFIYLIYVSKTHFQIVTEPEKFYIEGTIIICFWIAVLFDTRESIQPVKVEWQGAGMVVCVECGADCLYVVPSMSLPSTTPSFLASLKSRILLPFWYWLTQVVLEKRPRNGVTCSIPVLGPAVLSGPQVVGSEKIYGLWGTATCWTIVFTHATLCSCAVAKFSKSECCCQLSLARIDCWNKGGRFRCDNLDCRRSTKWTVPATVGGWFITLIVHLCSQHDAVARVYLQLLCAVMYRRSSRGQCKELSTHKHRDATWRRDARRCWHAQLQQFTLPRRH